MRAPGTLIQNRYRVIRQLGRGGMGTVYEAADERLDTVVALKESHFTEERLQKQFEREARLLAKLRHPAMTRVIDSFAEGDGRFLVMDFIAGEDLWERLQRNGGPFPLHKVLAWADQLLDALDYLHHQKQPIIHRDIKPHNLKLSEAGQIILLDFGLAKGAAGQVSGVTTLASVFGYTLNYAPLEQIQGTGTDPRSDLYSLAATLYHLATGVLPTDVLTRLTATTDGKPDPLRPAVEVNPTVPLEVSTVLQRALSPGRTQRFVSAAEMRDALRKAGRVSGIAVEAAEADLMSTLVDEAAEVASPEPALPPTVSDPPPTKSSHGPGLPALAPTETPIAASPQPAVEAPLSPPARTLRRTRAQLIGLIGVMAGILLLASVGAFLTYRNYRAGRQVEGLPPAEKPVVVALDSTPVTLDQLRGVDLSGEHIRQLLFNSLVRKNEKFDYVGELASDIVKADSGLSYIFRLRGGVKFHNGKALTSRDVKYTLETLLRSDSPKAIDFFEGVADKHRLYENGYISAIETPDGRTVVIRLRSPWLNLLANLVPVGIIPQDSTPEEQQRQPLGTGFYKFVRHDELQQSLDFEAFEEYWGGAPAIKKLRVRVILDTNTLQAELRSGGIDLAAVGILQPEDYQVLEQDPNLKVTEFPSSHLVYLLFNTQDEVLKDARVRRAIAHAINRESIVNDLLRGQVRVAYSVLPEESWAYHPGQTYGYDPEAAKRILQEAGYAGPKALTKPISFMINTGSSLTRRYATVIENSLRDVGVPAEVDPVEITELLDNLRKGRFQMATGRWVGGNQDPIFLRSLFLTGARFNRGRYSNPELDRILKRAAATDDRGRGRELYVQAQEIISREVPMFPLWYAAQMVVARKNVGNINVDMSGDWRFMRDLTVEGQ